MTESVDLWKILGAVVPELWPFALLVPVIVLMQIASARVERAARERRRGSMEERLDRAAAGMRDARELVDGVEAELAARQAALARLTAEAADWERLAALHRREAEAVATLLREEVSRGSRRDFWLGAGVNAIFFVMGYLVQLAQ